MRSLLRDLLETPRAAIGTWVTLTDPAVVEMIGLAGFDFVAVDLEHSAIGLETLQHHLRAAEARGLGTLVRVPSAAPKLLMRVLDAGAEGVLVPGATDARAARAALAGTRYPPAGDRGMSSLARSASFGRHGLGGLRELADRLNRSVVAGLMIEDREAVEDVDEIAAVPGLDLVFVGPTDLSASLGALGAAAHPAVVEAVERVFAACRRAGVAVGMPAGNAAYPLGPADLVAHGARLLTTGTDLALLGRGLEQALAAAGSGCAS